MRLGLGIVLLLIGAVLAFAVKDNLSGVNLTMVGYICMGVGALALRTYGRAVGVPAGVRRTRNAAAFTPVSLW